MDRKASDEVDLAAVWWVLRIRDLGRRWPVGYPTPTNRHPTPGSV